MSSLIASASLDLLNSNDGNTLIEALRLIMECSISLLEDAREHQAVATRPRRSMKFPDGVLDRIVKLLQSRYSLPVRVQASHAVFNMSASRTVREHMSRAGVIPLLVGCLLPETPSCLDAILPFSSTSSTSTSPTSPTSPSSPSSSETTLSKHEQGELCAKNALGALANFAVSSNNKLLIVEHGALAAIVDILNHTGKDNALQHACRCLFALGSDHENKKYVRSSIVSAGALRPLVQCLRHASSHVQWHAAGALANLSLDSSTKSRIVAHGGLEAMCELATTSRSDKVHRQVARGIFALTCRTEVRARLVKCGGLAPMVRLLSSKQKDLRRDAAGALGNVAMSPQLVQDVVSAGALPPLIDLAKSSIDLDLKREVVRTLYVLSYEENTRRAIVQHGGLDPLVALASDQKGVDTPRDVQEKAAGCLANIACGKGNKHYVVRAGGLRPLLRLLRFTPATVSATQGDEVEKEHSSSTGQQQYLEISSSGAVVVSKRINQIRPALAAQRSKSNASSSNSNINSNSNSKSSGGASDPYSAQRQAARALFALSGLEENQRSIVESEDGNGLMCLIGALTSLDHDVGQYAAGALANIALSTKYCGEVVRKGSVPLLLKLAKSTRISVQEQAIRGLKNLFGDRRSDSDECKEEGKEVEFTTLVKQADVEVVIVPGPDPLSNEATRIMNDMARAYEDRETTDLILSIDDGRESVNMNCNVNKDYGDGGDDDDYLTEEDNEESETKRSVRSHSGSSTTSNGSTRSSRSELVKCHFAIMASSSSYFAELAAAQCSAIPAPSTSSATTAEEEEERESDETLSSASPASSSSPAPIIVSVRGTGTLMSCQETRACWEMLVEYCYVGQIDAPCERILTYHRDRRVRRKATSEQKERILKDARAYYEQSHRALVLLAEQYGVRSMLPYLQQVYRACMRLLRVKPSSSSSSSKRNDLNKEEVEEERFGRLLRCRFGLHDVVFQTGDGAVLSAHRVIMCARSAYFRAMLAPGSQFSEASMDRIPVQVEEGAVFSILLRYMYTGHVLEELEPGNAFDLLNAAHLYGLMGLQTQAEDYIASECVNIENVIDVMNATSGIHVPRLRLHCIEHLIVHFDDLLNDAKQRVETIENVNIDDPWMKEFVVDRYYHWNQGRLWSDDDEEEEEEERGGEKELRTSSSSSSAAASSEEWSGETKYQYQRK